MRHAIAAASLALGLVAVAPAHADIYRWVDAQGSVHYSDRWQPGAELVQATHKGQSDTAAIARLNEQARLATTNDRIGQQLSQEQQAAIVRKETEQAQAQACKDATERYQRSLMARKIYVQDKPGERRLLDDKEAEEARIRARIEMQDLCAKSPSAPTR